MTNHNSIKGFIFNIKIVSNNRNSEEALPEVFKDLHEKKIRKKVSLDREIAIRTLFTTDSSVGKILYGKFASAIDLSDSEWLNIVNMEVQEYTVPSELKPKLRENEFVLVPNAHRLFFQIRSKENISHQQLHKFLVKGIKDVLNSDEDVEVIVEKDKEGVKVIEDALTVEWLNVKISKTNNDTNEDAAEWLDEQLGEMNVSNFNAKFVAKDKSLGLNTESKLIKGSLDLSVSNGEVEARIVDSDGQSRTVKTSDYVKRYGVFFQNEDSRISEIVNLIMRLFR